MKKTGFLISFLFWIAALSAQQTIPVKGIVTDGENGEELIGVSIVEKGTPNGTITGLSGDFSLEVHPDALLIFSYIGYKNQEIKASGPAPMQVRLLPDNQLLDELVVVGYTVQKRRDILGAVGKIDHKELNATPTASAQMALQGRIAGVQVSTQTGAPGSAISVRVRGVGSISSNNEPLYIVDGIPVEGGLSNLSPNEIEQVTVLKDASSAAIYGSRANNGVVLITTKSGKAGDTKINYNTQIGFQTHGRLTPMSNTAQYIELYNEAARGDNATSAIQRSLIEGDYLNNLADVNQLKEIFRTAPIQTHELSVSGGSEKTQYLLSLSYYNQEGIIKNTDYERLNVRSNIHSEVKDWLQVGLNMQAGSSSGKRISSSGDGFTGEGGSIVRYALFRNPAIPVYNDQQNFVDLPSEYYGNSVYNSFFGDGYNPVGLTENTDRSEKVKSLLLSGNIVIKLPAGFFIKSTLGVDYNTNFARTFNPTWGTANRINSINSLDIIETKNTNLTGNVTLNHSFQFSDKQSINWFAGTEAIRENGESLGGSESGFTDLIYLGKGKDKKKPYQSEWESALLSFFGSINYNFDQKYYLSLLLREDGSSRFTKGNRWGAFYALSAGWNMESEAFMQSLPEIYKLKLRAGYGSIGNQNVGLYANLDRYADQYYYAFGPNSYNGYILTKLGNTHLKWETSNQFNAGIDLEMWKGDFGATVDYFHKTTNDMLVEASLPPSVGHAAAPWINSGSVLNTGVDLELFYRKNYRDGGFNIALNGGYLHNEVLSLNAPLESGRIDSGVFATRTEVGYPIGSFFMYEMEGIFQNEMEIVTSAYQGRDIKPGDVKYKDNFEDGVIDEKDRVHAGSSIPAFTTGLNLSGYYKQWDMSLFFQGAFGQKIYSQVNQDIEGFYRGFNVTRRFYDERWTGEGASNTQPRASWSSKQNNAKSGTTRFLEDGSYLRLKNIQVGYTFPNTKKYLIENLRIYLAATNLFTLTGYSGLDPEMTVSTNSKGEGDRANGIDWGTYPVAMSYTLGLSLTF
jgi:TonB-linked SusC/RagA family outer membrane protein